MYNSDNSDSYVVRSESKWIYFSTFIILIYFDYIIIAILYFLFAVTLLGSDDDVDEELLDDRLLWEEMELFASLRPFEEQEGAVLVEWDFDELLEIMHETPTLPDNYPLVDSFVSILENIPKNRYNINLKKIVNEDVNEDVNRKALIKHKLSLTMSSRKTYLLNYSKISFKSDIVKFKSKAKIQNEYLTETELCRGLYPKFKYDFELYVAKNINLYCLFLEYLLIIDQNYNKHIISLVNYNPKRDINYSLDLIMQRALPTNDQLLKNIENMEVHFSDEYNNKNN